MATSKYSNPPPSNAKKATKKKAPAKKPSTPTKKSSSTSSKKPAPKAKASTSRGRVAKAKPASSESYKSAAAMFQGLIMEGRLTDDEIFAAVQEQFGLDDKKRSYVGWYRNKLKKDGQNPPEAK